MATAVDSADLVEEVEATARQIARPFVEKIEAAQVKGIEAVLALADAIIEARKALKPRGLFYRIFSDAKDPLPGCSVSMSSATADKITSIRERKAFSDPSSRKGLPTAWTTLYELTSLSAAEVSRLVEQRQITPDITVKEAHALVLSLYPKEPKQPRNPSVSGLRRGARSTSRWGRRPEPEAPIDTKLERPTLNTAAPAAPEAPERPEDVAQQGKASAAEILEQEITKTPAAVQQIPPKATAKTPMPQRTRYTSYRKYINKALGQIEGGLYTLGMCLDRGWKDRGFDQWTERVAALHEKLGAVLDLMRQPTCPTQRELLAICEPDEQDEADEAAGSSQGGYTQNNADKVDGPPTFSRACDSCGRPFSSECCDSPSMQRPDLLAGRASIAWPTR